MDSQLALARWSRTIVIAIAIVLVAAVAFAVPAGGTAPTRSTCVGGAAPVTFNGQWYCPGYVIGVKQAAYGVGTRIVLQSVTVLGVSGEITTVSGGPSCLTPGPYCGATIPSVTISLAGLSGRPATGNIVDVYGLTGAKTMSATGYVVTGSSSCDPAFC